jgi:hypothetical protein
MTDELITIDAPSRNGVPASGYYADHTAVSWSALEVFTESPERFHAIYVGQTQDHEESSPEMLLGNAIHCRLLERQHFHDRYIAAPKFDRRFSEGKTKHANWMREHGHRTALPAADMDLVEAMADAILLHPQAGKIVQAVIDGFGQTEQVFRWEDPETGIARKCRVDIVLPGLIVDVKSTTEVEEAAWLRTVRRYGYHRQSATYTSGYRLATGLDAAFLHIAVTKDYPIRVRTFELGPRTLQLGREEVAKKMRDLKACIDNGDFSDAGSKTIEIVEFPWLVRD